VVQRKGAGEKESEYGSGGGGSRPLPAPRDIISAFSDVIPRI